MTGAQQLPRGVEAGTITEALWRSTLPHGTRVREVASASATMAKPPARDLDCRELLS